MQRTARAATYEELQQNVKEATAAYKKATKKVKDLQAQIDETERKIEQIEQRLPELRARASQSLKALYLLHESSDGLIELLISSESFESFIACTNYLNRVQEKNNRAVEELSSASDELTEARDALAAQKSVAVDEAKQARKTQLKAIKARERVREEARRKAEEDRAAAEKALAEAAKSEDTFTNASGQEAERQTPEQSQPDLDDQQGSTTENQEGDAADEQTDMVASEHDAFIANWAPRIDAYLAGSPLAGQGTTFAEAAWDYNVDPRWSPAISTVESSKGAICFLPYNAWGWGGSSWDSWESAIPSHVAGLASVYGYTVTTEAAQMYCPTSWEAWYSSVVAEMNCI